MRLRLGITTAAIAAALSAQTADMPKRWSFAAHITPILTFGGCNQSACHGSPVGKNGFKLSLYGSEPEKDFAVLVTAAPGRRVNTKAPEESLMLRKPAMLVAHGGGPRFKKDSRHYQTIKAWIEAGAPFGDANAPSLARLEVTPGYTVLKKKDQTLPLKVMAIYSDNSREDVTGLSIFSSNDDGVLKVSSSGLVTAVGGTGDAAIMVRYAGKFAAPVFGATVLPVPAAKAPPALHPVDREIYAKLQQLNISPSPLCPDEEFLRRAHLDLIGTLPSAGEARVFLSSTDPDKRKHLVDALLERPEYADVQALLWADRLRSDSRFHRVGGVRAYYKWLREEFAANRPLDRFARALLTATGPNFTEGPPNFWGNYDKISTPIETAIQAGQVFLGVRIGCAQCHNHPFEKWTQSDFYSTAAVFSQVVEFPSKNGNFDLRIDPMKAVIDPATKKAAVPRYLGAGPIDLPPGEDRRVPFAAWLTRKDNPFFPRTMANIIWRNLMGRGIVHPVDDFRETNPATHPALLALLTKELTDHNFDQKHLIRFIMSSRAYQHAGTANETNRLDFKYYSRAYPRRMMSEVYMDAVAQVTAIPDVFKDWVEAKRAIQLPDNRYPSFFLDVFERSSRLVICDREENVTVPQALHFVNGPEIQQKITHENSRLNQWIAAGLTDAQLLEEMFLATLSRKPTAREKDRLLTRISKGERKEVLEDTLWAILNSKEFVFNH